MKVEVGGCCPYPDFKVPGEKHRSIRIGTLPESKISAHAGGKPKNTVLYMLPGIVRDVDVGVCASFLDETNGPRSPRKTPDSLPCPQMGPGGGGAQERRAGPHTNLKSQSWFRWRNNSQTKGQMGALRASRGVVAGSLPISYRSLSSPAAKAFSSI